jgi:hypothetical protein
MKKLSVLWLVKKNCGQLKKKLVVHDKPLILNANILIFHCYSHSNMGQPNMVQVKAISSDETFQEWLDNADMKILEKFFKKKKVDFKRDHVSAVETVQNVSKFIVVYFEKILKADGPAGKQTGATKTIPASQLEAVKFYDFKNEKVDASKWKGDKQVPLYTSIKEVKCSKCSGTGKTTVDHVVGVYDAIGKKTDIKKKTPEACAECKGTGVLYEYILAPVPTS